MERFKWRDGRFPVEPHETHRDSIEVSKVVVNTMTASFRHSPNCISKHVVTEVVVIHFVLWFKIDGFIQLLYSNLG